ncbi:MAG: prepilin-type N-terminal cleavage/methylation domain-containing protein [Lentisphaeria bacterium]|nr:prepilin-type N-terminal cleavage/methylation domain-containing protein [Lentisphaeria bacterium]
MKHIKSRYFSLIELLVVIAIISILTSLLLPSLSNAREKGREALCTSNVKQIILSDNMYQGDNDGVMGLSFAEGTSQNWIDNNARYTTVLKVYMTGESWETNGFRLNSSNFSSDVRFANVLCPSRDPDWKSQYYPDYGRNLYMMGRNSLGSPKSPKASDKVNWLKASSIPLNLQAAFPVLSECRGSQWNPRNFSDQFNTDGSINTKTGRRSRHLNKSVLGYLDGHVDTLAGTLIEKPYDSKYYNLADVEYYNQFD